MTLVSTGQLVRTAREKGTAAVGFNVVGLEYAEAVARGAENAGEPAILLVSETTVRHFGWQLAPLAAGLTSLAYACEVPLALHLDHVRSTELLHAAHPQGFSSVMYDASHLSDAENIAATAEAAQWAHARGLWIEAELGVIGGKRGDPPLDARDPGARTDPTQAAAYVEATGVDALAVAVGSSHAMTERSAALDRSLIRRLRGSVPVPLVLHGSSGVPDTELREAVAAGMGKINVGTALHKSYTEAVRRHLDRYPDEVDPRPALASAREEMTLTVEHFLRVAAEG